MHAPGLLGAQSETDLGLSGGLCGCGLSHELSREGAGLQEQRT